MRLPQSSPALPRYVLAIGIVLVGLPLSSVRAQGYISTWGFNSSPEYPFDVPPGPFVQLSTGTDHHGLALRIDGSIAAWGSDYYGQVSDAPTGDGYISVATGRNHSLALRADGSIVAWGIQDGHHLYDYGQVSSAPGGSGYSQVAGGLVYSLALGHDGSITPWGGGTVVSNAPTETGFTQIVGGYRHAHALRPDGSIVSWGSNQDGLVSSTPGGEGYIQVATGLHHSLALRADGSLVSWGVQAGSNDDHGQVSNTPPGTGFTQVAAGEYHSLALRADGSIVSWGSNSHGQVAGVPGDLTFTHVAATNKSSLALHPGNSGSAYCSGDGSGGACPCFSFGLVGEGCANSQGSGARLFAVGNAEFEQDAFQLEVMGVPDNRPGVILRGSSSLNGPLGLAVGDGLLCIGGSKAYSQVQFASGGKTTFSDFQGSPFGLWSYGRGVATNYQFLYRDPQNTCSGLGFNYSNAWAVTWL